MATSPPTETRIRSFKARQGRISPLTAHLLERWWPDYGLGPQPRSEALDGGVTLGATGVNPDTLDAAFQGRPLVIEIGCGMGEAAVAMGQAEPDIGILAIDVHLRGLARTLRGIADAGLSNVKVAHGDAAPLLESLPPASLAGVRLYFPDPWPKIRHHKRRLIRGPFVDLVAERLYPGGTLHIATDWAHYAAEIDAVLEACPRLEPAGAAGEIPRPAWRPVTRYERDGREKGHRIHDFLYRANDHPIG